MIEFHGFKVRPAYSNKDGRVAGYNPNTLVTTIIEGDQVQIIREWDSAIVDITINQSDGGHKINIDQKGSTVPEIYTNETSYNSTIDITIRCNIIFDTNISQERDKFIFNLDLFLTW